MAQNTSLHYTIYLDRLFIEYLVVYLLLMLLVGFYLRRKIPGKRLFFCAVMWSLAGLGCLFLPVSFRRWGSVLIESLVGLGMFVYIYGRPGKQTAVGIFLALVISVMYLTGCLGVSYRLEKLTGIEGVRIFIGILLTLAFILWWIRQSHTTLFEVLFVYQGKEYTVRALLDTGNSLREPITGKAVCLIEQGIIAPDIPGEGEGIYIVPYHSVGTDAGVLLAVKVQQVRVMDGSNTYTCDEMFLAVYRGQFTPSGKYRMLLHQDYLKERNGIC